MSRIHRLGIVLLMLAVGSPAQAAKVDCDKARLSGALADARPRETILIRGICRENLVIGTALHDVTIDGGGSAAIVAPNEREPVLVIRAQKVTLRGLGLAGGRDGVEIAGGSAVIEDVTVEDNGTAGQPGSGIGILVAGSGSAAVLGTRIRRNAGAGIVVRGGSARIGPGAGKLQPTIVSTNGGDGILLLERAQADVAGCTVSRNRGNGIHVTGGSALEAADNAIEANAAAGIAVVENSTVKLASGKRKSNRTDPAAKNSAYGLACLAGTVEGALGTLAGARGTSDIAKACRYRPAP